MSRNYFFRVGVHDISSSNEPIYLKFGVNVLYIFLYRLNHDQIKIFNFIIFKKFRIVKKHAKKKNFFSNDRQFMKKYFFDFSKVHAIAASILIKNPDDQKGWNHARQDTLFFGPPILPAHNFVNFEFFSINFLCNLKISINKW